MPAKLTAKQQAQLGWLQTLPPRFERLNRLIEQLAAMQADETQLRSTQRMLDELKAQASSNGIPELGDTFGYMGTLLRRGGGHQLKVRGLRELFVGAKVNFEGALRRASTPEDDPTSP